MYPYILCYCGRELGSLYDLFKIMRNAEYEKVFEGYDESINPAIICLSEESQINLEHVYRQLNIHLHCCRIRLLTEVEFKLLG